MIFKHQYGDERLFIIAGLLTLAAVFSAVYVVCGRLFGG
jgi:hypothetical protein